MITVKRRLHVTRQAHGRVSFVETPPAHETAEPGRVPRVSRLMALAITFDKMLREGKVKDLSELARLAHVTQPRMTQIMNLNHLAPDIQEAILYLPPLVDGRDPITERDLRPIIQLRDWREQRPIWRKSRSASVNYPD